MIKIKVKTRFCEGPLKIGDTIYRYTPEFVRAISASSNSWVYTGVDSNRLYYHYYNEETGELCSSRLIVMNKEDDLRDFEEGKIIEVGPYDKNKN